MSDRGMMFLFSVFMVLAGGAAAVWLLATGQASTVDGLFLLLTALLIAAAFAMYAVFMIRRAMEAAAAKTSPQAAKAGAGSPAGKPAPAPVAQE